MALQGSKIKQPYAWAIVLVLVVVAWFLVNQNDPVVEQPMALPQDHALTILNTGSDKLRKAEEVLAEANKTIAGQTAESGAAETPPMAITAWRIANADSTAMPVPNGVSIYEPVSVDMDSPVYPSPGEQVSLPLPGGETVNATVKSSNENPNGDYSWRGYLDGHGADYPVVMTYGGNSVFATVTTPQGSYTLESINGSGWVYKNPAEFELSDPGKNDYLEVPHTHNHD
ncbi:hypothetical protein [Cellvibrio mixtus]|uniref:hypothetical protein n=1 Tax=Cellvibrio mixtus TaxID=39650 RepID=UPI0006945971|nr:hypothetical protein [Cellvibrio mixtus]